MLQVALHGFHAARARYYDQLAAGHPEEHMIIPAMELTYWACVLDEQLEARDPVYQASAVYGRKIMSGTRFARNRANHQLPMLIERVPGFVPPIRFPLRTEEMVWLPFERLPSGQPAPSQEREYKEHLAGKPVRHTIDHIAAWFASEQNRDGSPLAGNLGGPGA
jgi:hypothetical protein